MDVLIWIGAALALLGVAGLVWSALLVVGARRARLDEQAFKARMAWALPLNVGALFLSLLGLTCVVVGAVLA